MKLLLSLLLLAPLTVLAQTVTQTNKVEITPTYSNGVTQGENVITMTNPNGQAFGFNLSQTLQGNDPNDDVVMWGWNVDANTPNEPTFRFAMERQFGTVTPNFELHLETITPLGGYQRPWTWTVNRSTGEAVIVASGASHFYGGGWLVQGGPEIHVGTAEVLSQGPSLRYRSNNISFETLTNGGANAKQIRVLPHLSDPDLSRLTFGDSGGVGLANVGNELQVQRNGNPSTITAGAYKAFGVKVIGAQCGAVLDSNGTLTDTVRAVNATLACLRSHGLVAP